MVVLWLKDREIKTTLSGMAVEMSNDDIEN